MSDAPELLTIADLAARWGVSPRRAREIAGAADGPPRIHLVRPAKYVCWTHVRFRRGDLLDWEAARAGETTAGPSPSPAVKLRPTGPRPVVPNRLGDWRN